MLPRSQEWHSCFSAVEITLCQAGCSMNDELCDLVYDSKSQAGLSDYSQIPGVLVQIVFQERSFCLGRDLFCFQRAKLSWRLFWDEVAQSSFQNENRFSKAMMVCTQGGAKQYCGFVLGPIPRSGWQITSNDNLEPYSDKGVAAIRAGKATTTSKF